MPRKNQSPTVGDCPPASITVIRGRWVARPRLPGGYRPSVDLGPSSWTEAKARESYAAACERGLVAALLETKARKGGAAIAGTPQAAQGPTVRDVGTAWTSGKLLATYGKVEGLDERKGAWMAFVARRLAKHVYPEIGDMPVVNVTPADIERVLRRVGGLAATTANAYRSHLRMLFHFARRLLRLRNDNPVDDAAALTPDKEERDFTWLYPAELVALISCPAVPLPRRVAYALAVYTGLRKGSQLALTWASLDATNGTLTVRKTKTGRPLFFAVDPALLEVLLAWRRFKGSPSSDLPIIDALELGWFANGSATDLAAKLLRADLRTAGCTRERLYEEGQNVEPLRYHDCRATFISWARRQGRDSYWITSRSGHCDEAMIERYTRAAKVLEELSVDVFPSLSPLVRQLDEHGRKMDAAGADLPRSPAFLEVPRGSQILRDHSKHRIDRARRTALAR